MCAVCGAAGWTARRSNQSFPPAKTEVTLKFHRLPPEWLLRTAPPILTHGVTSHLDSVNWQIVYRAAARAQGSCGLAREATLP